MSTLGVSPRSASDWRRSCALYQVRFVVFLASLASGSKLDTAELNGASLALVRAARRAAKRGDAERALALAEVSGGYPDMAGG